jgi:hypothetical protein
LSGQGKRYVENLVTIRNCGQIERYAWIDGGLLPLSESYADTIYRIAQFAGKDEEGECLKLWSLYSR